MYMTKGFKTSILLNELHENWTLILSSHLKFLTLKFRRLHCVDPKSRSLLSDLDLRFPQKKKKQKKPNFIGGAKQLMD